MKSALVVHALSYRHRRTTTDFVMSFDRYTPDDAIVTYHNVRRPQGRDLAGRGFDAMLLPYDLLSLRSSRQWPWVMEVLTKLRPFCDRVIAFPKDLSLIHI